MNRPLRIVVPIHSFDPGGVERVALNLAAAWRDHGQHVRVILGRNQGAMAAAAPALDYWTRPSSVPTRPFETIWMTFLLWQYLGENEADILFCGGNTYAVVVILARLLLGKRCPAIVAKISNDLARRDMPRPLRWGYRQWLRLQGRLVDTVVGMAEPMRSEIAEALQRADNDVAIIADPSLTTEQHARLSSIQRHSPDMERQHFLAIGRLVPQKNFPMMIEAFAGAASTSATLTILGDGPERKRLDRLARRLGVAGRVHFAGHVDDTTPWLRASTALLLSSDYEGVPAVVIEALAAGLPIIATNCSVSMPELLGNGLYGALVPVGDIAAFRRAIQSLPHHEFDRDGARATTAPFTVAHASYRYLNVLRQARMGAVAT